ncbi:polysaccharide biosynthesis C-terminal domain-containing protein [Limosilactobacillus reuteri subsp. suis]|uniref:oligosaccharide flippase family protein n=1 Tax=Limosilactobacillus reuteri TaxID=1598 RepID=UPI003992600E
MKVVKNYLYNISYNILTLVLPLITGPYVSRRLGATGVGINSYTYSIINWFVLCGSIGIAYYGNRQIAYVKENKYALTQNFVELQILKSIFILLSYSIFIIYICINKNYIYYLLIQSIYIIAAGLDISWLYMGLENFKITVIRNTLVKVSSVILILILVKDKSDTGIYISIMAIGTLLGNLTLWPSLTKVLLKINWHDLHPFRHLRGSISLFIPLAAVQLYVGLNKTMLGALDSTNASGFYDKADSLVKLVLTLVTSLAGVLMPYTAKSVASGDMKKVKNVLYLAFDFSSFVAFPIAFGIAGISIKFGPFFYGKEFKEVGIALFIESIVMVFMSWSSITGNQYLVPTNQVKPYTVSIFIGAFVNIILNVPLILNFGVKGAVVSTVLAELAVSFYQIWYIRKEVDIKIMFNNTLKYFVSSLIMFIIVFILNSKLEMNILTLIFEISIGCFIYLCLIFILKPTIINYINDFIVTTVNKIKSIKREKSENNSCEL